MKETTIKQIEEMAKIIDERLIEARGYLGSMNKGEGYWIAQKLIEYYQPKLPELPCLTCPVPDWVQNEVDCSTICGAVRSGIDWQNQCRVLVRENKELKRQLGCYIADQEILLTAPKAIFKKLMNRDEFLLHTNEQGCMFYVDFVAWLNEIAKELGIEVGETK